MRKYASHARKRAFSDMKEWLITQAAALMYETMYENALYLEYFNEYATHKATVMQSVGGYVKLKLSVERMDGITMPAITPGSRIELCKVKYAAENITSDKGKGNAPAKAATIGDYLIGVADEEDSSDKTKAPVLTLEQIHGPVHATVIAEEIDQDFVVSFSLKKPE